MSPEIAKLLEDVRQACLLVESFTQGKSFSHYVQDSLLRSGVERQFITIGEAFAQADKLDANLHLSVTAFRQIVGFRNLLVHGYAIVDHPTVWGVVANDLQTLKREVDGLLGAGPSP